MKKIDNKELLILGDYHNNSYLYIAHVLTLIVPSFLLNIQLCKCFIQLFREDTEL